MHMRNDVLPSAKTSFALTLRSTHWQMKLVLPEEVVTRVHCPYNTEGYQYLLSRTGIARRVSRYFAAGLSLTVRNKPMIEL